MLVYFCLHSVLLCQQWNIYLTSCSSCTVVPLKLGTFLFRLLLFSQGRQTKTVSNCLTMDLLGVLFWALFYPLVGNWHLFKSISLLKKLEMTLPRQHRIGRGFASLFSSPSRTDKPKCQLYLVRLHLLSRLSRNPQEIARKLRTVSNAVMSSLSWPFIDCCNITGFSSETFSWCSLKWLLSWTTMCGWSKKVFVKLWILFEVTKGKGRLSGAYLADWYVDDLCYQFFQQSNIMAT